MWCVYILQCENDTLYTGITNNLEKRFADHQAGKGGKYTRSHTPVAIVYTEEYASKSDALKREIAIKSLTRAQKQTLIKHPITSK